MMINTIELLFPALVAFPCTTRRATRDRNDRATSVGDDGRRGDDRNVCCLPVLGADRERKQRLGTEWGKIKKKIWCGVFFFNPRTGL